MTAAARRRGPAPRQLSLRSALPYFIDSRRRFVLLALAAAAEGFAEAGMLVLVVRIAFEMARDSDVIEVSFAGLHAEAGVGQVLVAAMALALVQCAFAFITARMASRISARIRSGLRRRTFNQFIHADWDLQAKHREGHLQELTSTHVTRIAAGSVHVTMGVVGALNFLALLISALLINSITAAAILIAVVILFFLFRPISRAARRLSHKSARADVDFVNSIAGHVSLAQEIATFDVADAIEEEVDLLVEKAEDPQFRFRFLSTLLPGLYKGSAVLLVLVGLSLVSGMGTGGLASLGATMLLLIRALSYGQLIQKAYHSMNEAVPYVEQIEEQLEAYRASSVARDGEALPAISVIEFAKVGYSYSPERPALDDVSFRVSAGETLGIVGPSGGGKSTLLQILLRLRDPSSGQLLVNGIESTAFARDQWFGRIGFVSQDSRLFRGTVEDNIRFYREIDGATVRRAARLAHIHDDVMSWPNQYNTDVGERGNAVSGGQRQRICIARALARDPDLLVLDEPTSALDMNSEEALVETLRGLKGRLLLVVVAHRLSVLRICDEIMVLRDGRIEALAPASELMNSNAFYQEAERLTRLSSPH